MSDYELLAYRLGQLEKAVSSLSGDVRLISNEVVGWKARASMFSSMWGVVAGIVSAMLTKLLMPGER